MEQKFISQAIILYVLCIICNFTLEAHHLDFRGRTVIHIYIIKINFPL